VLETELLSRSGPPEQAPEDQDALAPPLCPHCGGQHLVKMLSAPAAPGKSREIIASARRQAAREGHFSHYSSSEKPRG
jgi:hypothetical protein